MSIETLAGKLLTNQELSEVSGGDGVCISVPTIAGCPTNPDGTVSACDDTAVGDGCGGPPMAGGGDIERHHP